jgi:hypothetical protein
MGLTGGMNLTRLMPVADPQETGHAYQRCDEAEADYPFHGI